MVENKFYLYDLIDNLYESYINKEMVCEYVHASPDKKEKIKKEIIEDASFEALMLLDDFLQRYEKSKMKEELLKGEINSILNLLIGENIEQDDDGYFVLENYKNAWFYPNELKHINKYARKILKGIDEEYETNHSITFDSFTQLTQEVYAQVVCLYYNYLKDTQRHIHIKSNNSENENGEHFEKTDSSGGERTTRKKDVKQLELSEIFDTKGNYKFIMDLLVKKKYCHPNTFYWIDKKKGYKGFIVQILKDLEAKKYYRQGVKFNYDVCKVIMKKTFNVTLGSNRTFYREIKSNSPPLIPDYPEQNQ